MTDWRDRKPLESLLVAWTGLVCRWARTVLALTLFLVVALGWYAGTGLGVDTDTTDMISDRFEWRRDYVEFKNAFPHFSESLLVVVDGASPELADDAASRLAAAMSKHPDLFPRVEYLSGEPFFRRNGLLFLSLDELEDLADELVRVQPLIGRLARSPSLGGLADTLGAALGRPDAADAPQLDEFLGELARAFRAAREDEFFRLSWRSLGAGGAGPARESRRLVQARAELDYEALLPGRKPVEWIRARARELELVPEAGVDVRLTGAVPLMHEELLSVQRGAALAGTATLVLVTVVLFAALGSWRLIAAALVTLLAGLTATAAFAGFAVGRLNLISVAFAVLYIGLAIDFAIHLCLRYRELLGDGADQHEALTGAAGSVGVSLAICAVTTSIGFFAFYPTDFDGVAELGLISGTGIYISLFATLTVLPAILTVLPVQPTTSGRRRRVVPRVLMRAPERYSGTVLAGAALVGVAALALLPSMRFDPSPMNLRDPDSESVAAFRDLLADSDMAPMSLSVLAEDDTRARQVARRLEGLEVVRETRTLHDFIPAQQQPKLAVVEELRLVLGPSLQSRKADAGPDERRRALLDLAEALEEAPGGAGTRALRAELAEWRDELAAGTGEALDARLAQAERNVFHYFPARLEALREALTAAPVERADLPRSLLENWVGSDGRYRVEVIPRGDILEREALARFVSAVREEAPRATGKPLANLYAGDVVKDAFREAFGMAAVAVVAVLLLLLRSVRATLVVLVPLILAMALTGAVGVLAGIPWNFANVITLPLLLGMGVDSSIHMVHRMQAAPPRHGELLATSTARAVLYSALTTICSFGNLMLSGHAGMATMGKMLTVGMTMVVLTTLVVLPAALARWYTPSAEVRR